MQLSWPLFPFFRLRDTQKLELRYYAASAPTAKLDLGDGKGSKEVSWPRTPHTPGTMHCQLHTSLLRRCLKKNSAKNSMDTDFPLTSLPMALDYRRYLTAPEASILSLQTGLCVYVPAQLQDGNDKLELENSAHG